MKKRNVILLSFLLFAGAMYPLTTFLIQRKINNHTLRNQEDVISNALSGLYYVTIGLIIYFIVINFTSIIGLVISWRRKDIEAKTTFTMLTILTIAVTIIFFSYYFQQ